ncbi:MAG: hypothetical protein H6806_12425 [Planctomycetes bacterium]|nr:hypothetical protein [Planctomycetota bacterium]MCB9830549.1 hypothetical protein [Planctomycetota bacterium]MCB9901307.1 hypothetical protein [Planctomycetota bacterium]
MRERQAEGLRGRAARRLAVVGMSGLLLLVALPRGAAAEGEAASLPPPIVRRVRAPGAPPAPDADAASPSTAPTPRPSVGAAPETATGGRGFLGAGLPPPVRRAVGTGASASPGPAPGPSATAPLAPVVPGPAPPRPWPSTPDATSPTPGLPAVPPRPGGTADAAAPSDGALVAPGGSWFDGDRVLPERPPVRPVVRDEPEPGEVSFQVARPGGLMRLYRDEVEPETRRIVVMVGTPRIVRPAHERVDDQGRRRHVEELVVKANAIVAWVDRRGFPGVDAYGGLDLAADEPRPQAEAQAGFPMGKTASVIPEFLLGIYAEGAVELTFGDQRFTAESLYLDPHAFRGLLVNPRVDGRAKGIEQAGEEGLPLHLRARLGRLEARGLTVFEDAEVTTSRSDDRIALQVETLRVEEFAERYGADGAERPHFVGFQARSTQRYEGRGITVRGERLPLVRVGEAAFGLSDATEGFPTLIRGVRAGSRNHLGRYGFVELGGAAGPREDPIGEWYVELGGYTKRGPALLPGFRWDRRHAERGLRSTGRLDGFLLFEQEDEDRTGYRPGDVRHRLTLESRTWLSDDLTMDVEVNDFSDRGVNNEFFERDDLEHKDRESYARLRWAPERPGTFVGTLTGKWHQRGFVTETLEEPVAGLWVQSLPVIVPWRRGDLGVDLTSESSAGRYRRTYDDRLGLEDEAAWRFASTTRLNGRLMAGDVILSGYTGIAADHLTDIEGAGAARETTRTAFEAGVRAHLQMHRTWCWERGGCMGLDGLRHVMDYEVGYAAREGGGDDVRTPWFDRREALVDQEALLAETRQRWQTRREDGSTRDLVDLRLAVAVWLDDRGPYGREAPGVFQAELRGEPFPDVFVRGDLDMDLDGRVASASTAAEWRTRWGDGPLRLSGGYRYVEDVSSAFTAEMGYSFSPRYSFEILSHFDVDDGETLHRLMFHRTSIDHLISFGIELRDGSPQLELTFSPAIGGRPAVDAPLFRDVFDPSTSRSLRR